MTPPKTDGGSRGGPRGRCGPKAAGAAGRLRATELALAFAMAVSPLSPRGASRAGEIRDFPVLLRAGLPSDPGTGERFLPDLPFSLERGYGHLGGAGRAETGKTTFGGDPSWPLSWREGMESYVFQVPNGEYLLECAFIETEVAAPGLRVFDVLAEGQAVFPRLDVAGTAGDFVWLTLAAAVAVRDGWLDLRFVGATEGRPPTIARLRLSRRAPAGPPPPPALAARGSAECVVLRWELPPTAVASGYAVFRAESPSGPFASLSAEPVRVPWFVDRRILPGEERWYRVRAYGPRGEEGELSEAVAASPLAASDLGLKVYHLRIPEDRLREILQATPEPREAAGELRYLDAVEPVTVRVETAPERWQAKKSFSVEFEGGRARAFGRRRALFLSAEAGDPTRLGELVYRAASSALGLAVPQAEPATVLLNGRYLGTYLDLEIPDRRFRRRAGLDAVGLLARKTRDDRLSPSWDPYGERIDEGGDVGSLAEFVHELNCLGDSEIERFFEERLYLARFLDRAALSALAGDARRGDALALWLEDSRNGRWEFLPAWRSGGAWGPATSRDPGRDGAFDPARLVWGASLLDGGGGIGGAGVLESRFFSQRALRLRFLRRLQEILAGELSPESLDRIVDGEFAKVRRALVEDAFLWEGSDGEASVLEGPARLKAEHRARAGALAAYLAREAARDAPELILTEVLALPESGSPWVEIQNVSEREVDLGRWILSKAFGPAAGSPSAERARLPARRLEPGAFAVIPLVPRETIALGPAERFLALYRASGSAGADPGAAAPSDFVFLGQPARGRAYGRLGGRGRWAYLATSTPGAPNGEDELQPPSWRFRQGIAPRDGEAYEIWFQPLPPPGGPPGSRPAKVSLRLREEGGGEFVERAMAWEEKEYRFSARVEKTGKRIAYTFAAESPDGIERAYPLPAPSLAYAVPVLPEAKINEVLPRPLPSGSGPPEFVEIYNPTDSPIDLGGCFLTDTRRNPIRWRIPAGTTIGPKGFAVFYADGRDRGNHTSFRLSNTGEYLGLYGRREEGNLLIDSIAYRGLRAGESWGALPDGTKNFRAWKDPTPGAKNIPKIPEGYLEAKAREKSGAEPQAGQPAAPKPEGRPSPPDEEPSERDDGGEREFEEP